MNKKGKVICISLIFLLILNNLAIILNANTELSKTKGSLTITQYEKEVTGNGEENKPLKGVTFSIYKVADNETSTEIGNNTVLEEKTTGDDGVVRFDELELGRYLVVEKSAPENVIEKIANFLVDIPQTSVDGTRLIYDVAVYPKNNTAYGAITLTKQNEKSEKLNGVTFCLQKKVGESWSNYPDDTKAFLQTNTEGNITVENLPIGDYRFIETSLGSNRGYILDNNSTYEFRVSLEDDLRTLVVPGAILVTNEKPEITKTITDLKRNPNNTNSVTDGINSVDVGDTVIFTINVDVPEVIKDLATYKINDTMDTGLSFIEEGFEIKGLKEDSTEAGLTKNSDYTLTKKDNGFELNFVNGNLIEYTNLKVIYKAVLNSNANATSIGNKNTSTLTYSTMVTTDYKGEENEEVTDLIETEEVRVYTGGLQIEKRENAKTGEPLDGAVFKIATTRENAESGIYIKDAQGRDIILTTRSGKASYKGLTYGTYFLVEIQAPSYIDNGETKYYNLLDKPVEITIDGTTFEANANIIINRKQTILPFTGAQSGIIGIIGLILVTTGIIIGRKKKLNK